MNEVAKPAALAIDRPTSKEQLRVVIVGHVDHGKSTLVGRLFHDTGMLPDGKFEAIEEMCRRRGMPFEWAFLMDSLKAERDQGITIDTSQIWFRHADREYVLIDAPGHREFIRNMVTGASNADAALLLIDADHGVRGQSRHHGYLLQLLGVRQVAVAVNKMDLIDYDEERFRAIEAEYRAYLEGLDVTPTCVIPISAREGDNVAAPSDKLGWHSGPTVLDVLAGFAQPASNDDAPLRLPLQDIYKFDDRRILAGRIESGRLKPSATSYCFRRATTPPGWRRSRPGTKQRRSPGPVPARRSVLRSTSKSSSSAAKWPATSKTRRSRPMSFTCACFGYPIARSRPTMLSP